MQGSDEEMRLLMDALTLADTGLLLRVNGSERGVVISSLQQIPEGSLWITPQGVTIRRIGNVLLYGDTALDIAMREVYEWSASLIAGEQQNEQQQQQQQSSCWTLPPKLTERVLSWLDERSLVMLGATCRGLHTLCMDAVVWMTLFAKRFRYLPPYAPGVTKDGFKVSSRYWISRFAYQREEVSSFGSFHLSGLLTVPEARIVKMVLIGPSNVGKTSLIAALKAAPTCKASHARPYEPTMFVRTSVAYGFVGGAKGLCGLKIWDIPGEARNRSVSSVYCSDTHCVVCVFDSSRRDSFLQLRDWILDVRLHITKSRNTKLVVVACKSDLEMPLDLEREAQIFARQERISFLKCSLLSQETIFEWKLFCWRLAADTLKVSFV